MEGHTAASETAKTDFCEPSWGIKWVFTKRELADPWKGPAGGYWIQGNMGNDLWKGVEQELTEMSGVANSRVCERVAFLSIGKIAESRART
jgi:hypothetical protein